MVLKNTRKKKLKQVENMDSAEDKISRLPDDLIHRILSFVPTKCAICTSILSKRWKRVSNSIPTLDFRNWRTHSTRKELKQETKQFMNYLDTVLYQYEKPFIDKFYLDLDGFFDESRVSKWISTIINRKVEEFYLYDSSEPFLYPQYSTPSIFPRSFFTCASFTQLELHFSELFKGIVNVPDTVSFPNLKKLRLKWVSFVNEASNRKFFSNSPILEELTLINCWMCEGLSIVNPALKHLFVTYCYFDHSSVFISAPGLLTISYRGDEPADFVLNSFPSLVDANVDFDNPVEFGDPKVVVQLLEKLSSVKHLKMSAQLFEVLKESDILVTSLPTFNNLIKLEICTQSPYHSSLDSISEVRTLFKFLHLSPNLESILFAQNIGIPDEEADGCLSLDPRYSLPHLKSIKFMDFDGEPAHLNAIKLILKYAGFLETVTFVASPGLSKDLKKQLDVTKLLLKFPKPTNCVIDVVEQA